MNDDPITGATILITSTPANNNVVDIRVKMHGSYGELCATLSGAMIEHPDFLDIVVRALAGALPSKK